MQHLLLRGTLTKANFRTIAPKYFQHITIVTRVVIMYLTTATLLPGRLQIAPPAHLSANLIILPFCSCLLRQKLKREAPALRTIQCWSDQSDAILQDCFDHVDWDMFRAASDDDIEAYSDSVTCFIRKCVEDVVPTKTICIYPNQKPWINSDVQAALSARTSAFKSGNFDDRKQASYDFRKSIKAVKRQYKNKVEEQFNTNNAMWQGINNITDCKGNKPATVNIAASLPDELNLFNARFEAHNTAHTESAPRSCCRRGKCNLHFCCWCNPILQTGEYPQGCGPDGITGRVLRACAFQLAGVFTDIFKPLLSLSVCGSLISFKKSTIVPIPKKIKSHAWMTGGPLLWHPSSASVLRNSSETTSALCCLPHWIRCNLHIAATVPQTMLLPSSCILLSPTWKTRTLRMLFVDYSSAFNTIVPATLVAKLQTLGLNRSLCSWILVFLTGRS